MNHNLKIVFLGTPDFAVESLRRICDAGYNVVGVVTMPDKPAGRKQQLQQSAVKKFAVEHGLHLMQPQNLKDPQFIAELRSLEADLFVVIAFRMLPREVWQMPPMGTFNLHASLLPLYRGAAPINRAVMNGETRTGVTTFMLKHEIDTGDILRQESIEIGPDEDVGSVHDRLMMLGADLTLDTIDHLDKGDLKPIPQDSLLQGVQPTPAPKIFTDDCRIDWHRTAQEVHNHVRGLSPYPAAWTMLHTVDADAEPLKIKIYATLLTDRPVVCFPAGTIDTSTRGRLFVACADRWVEVISIQAPGKRRLDTADFLLGQRAPLTTME